MRPWLTEQKIILLALFIITLTALVGGLIVDNNAVITLAATGLGAFAGAVSNIWGNDETPTKVLP